MCTFNALVYFVFTIIGAKMLFDLPYFPKCLGGVGDANLMFANQPYPRHYDGMMYYYMFALGWHIEAFAKMLIFDGKRPDIIEMSLHHVFTAYLVCGSYLTNFQDVGTIIFFLHDFGTIFLASTRALSESSLTKTTTVVFFLNLACWIYTRLGVFGWVIYTIIVRSSVDIPLLPQYVRWYFIYLTIGLWCLHLYWFTLMINILIGKLKGKGIEDTQANFKKKGD